jgi:hypothetical protein
MPEPKHDDDEKPGDPNARWGAEAAGIEPLEMVGDVEDMTTAEQRARNAKAAEMRDAALLRAQEMADEGQDDDDEEAGDSRKD